MIVKRKIVRWDLVDACLRLQPPMSFAQLPRRFLKLLHRRSVRPVPLQCELQLPPYTDAVKAEIAGNNAHKTTFEQSAAGKFCICRPCAATAGKPAVHSA